MSDEIVREVSRAFEDAWAKTIEEYKKATFIPANERDLQLHIACNLRDDLRDRGWANWVRIDFPVPLEPERLDSEPFLIGAVIQNKVKKPDIVVADTSEIPWKIYLIAEVKYIVPRSIMGGIWIGCLWRAVERENVEMIRVLRREGFLYELKRDIEWYDEHGADALTTPVLNDLKKVAELMSIYRGAGLHVAGYVCVIDEIYGYEAESYRELMERYEKEYPDVKLLYFTKITGVPPLTKLLSLLLSMAEEIEREKGPS